MIELSKERMEQLLNEEATKKEDVKTILRCLYTRYMLLYEKYFADIDSLNIAKVTELRNYHEETKSLFKYYYLDIPEESCEGISEFDKRYTDKLLGPQWYEFLSENYKDYKDSSTDYDATEEELKAGFSKKTLENFYDAMDYIFRDGFGTSSKTAANAVSSIAGLLFGKEKKD